MIGDDPELIPPGALRDVTVGISVSDSADLARLGLHERHVELAVGEIARAVLISGGAIAYGGWLRQTGFTHQLMNEIRRFGVARHSLTLYVALPEHASLPRDELDFVDRELGTWGRMITLDEEGTPTDWRELQQTDEDTSDASRAAAYSGLRRCIADNTDGRILLGGKLRGYRGAMPGIVEEAILAVERRQPIYLAAGFGGAAASVARRLQAGSLDWLPAWLPEGENDQSVQAALGRLESLVSQVGYKLTNDGLTDERRALLCASHRPGEIASLSVVGLAARFSSREGHG